VKKDIDTLLGDRNLDAAVVMGSTLESPTIYYLVDGAKLENVIIILRSGQPSILVHGDLDRYNATATGYRCVAYSNWDLAKIREAVDGDSLVERVELIRQILAQFGVRGRVGFYGHEEIGKSYTLLSALAPALHSAELVTEYTDDLFTVARITKDTHEIKAMDEVGKLTCQVVGEVADLLTSRPVSNSHLMAPGGEPMTVGHVKDFIRAELSRRGLEEPTEHIFAIGADAAIPHHHGNRSDLLSLGKAIVFDIFPRPVGGGYYHDMTRTWCLGYAPPEVQQAYEHVMASFDLAVAALSVARPTTEYQKLVCDYFEAQGHPTVLHDPTTLSGYVHGLGHGLGLQVHEEPRLSHRVSGETTLEPGMVFTIEPGLYYQEQGFGVRIEDTYYCDDMGQFHGLTPFSKDLVLPVRQ
jgi:Xaa-Pro aminopeptidase